MDVRALRARTEATTSANVGSFEVPLGQDVLRPSIPGSDNNAMVDALKKLLLRLRRRKQRQE